MYVGLIGDLLFFRKVLIDWYFSQEGQEGRDVRKGQEGLMYKSKIVKLYLNNCCFHIKNRRNYHLISDNFSYLFVAVATKVLRQLKFLCLANLKLVIPNFSAHYVLGH